MYRYHTGILIPVRSYNSTTPPPAGGARARVDTIIYINTPLGQTARARVDNRTLGQRQGQGKDPPGGGYAYFNRFGIY